MKHSIVYKLLDGKGDKYIAISSGQHMDRILKTSRQLICCIGIIQTDEERAYTASLTKEELARTLQKFMDDNELYLFYPN